MPDKDDNEYVRHERRLPYVRGSLDTRRLATRPWDPLPHCSYQQHTPNIDDNRILTWTLHSIARSGRAGEASLRQVRQAFHAMDSFAAPMPFVGSDCSERRYNRLNDDYERLHALCRFFLEGAGPQLESGGRSMVPFLIDTAKLYEEFVAAWLTRHVGDDFDVGSQVRVDFEGTPDMHSRIDLTLRPKGSHRVLCVLDTKYKIDDEAKHADVYQVTSYALTQDCTDAFLVYPEDLRPPMDIRVKPAGAHAGEQGVRVRSLTFPVRQLGCAAESELDACGRRFVQDLRAAIDDR